MTELADLSWRAYPAAALIAVGAVAALAGVRRMAVGPEVRDPPRALRMVRGIRAAIAGLACAGVGAAWWGQIGWLFGLSLIIGVQEMIEASLVIAALVRSRQLTGDS